MAPQFQVRTIVDAEVDAFIASLALGFGYDPGEGQSDRFRRVVPIGRAVAAFASDEIVGTLAEFDLRLTVPGSARVPMAGTTMVTVRSTHRRQGVLRAMMQHHLQAAVDRGDTCAALWASEPEIYGRYGFGLAIDNHFTTIDGRHLGIGAGPSDVQVDLIRPEQVAEQAGHAWEQAAAVRSGFVDRSAGRWTNIISDPVDRRGGKSALRYAIARRDGEPIGYLSYRQAESWVDEVPHGSVAIQTLLANDPGAHRALWHFVTNVDLFPTVTYWNAAVDEPVGHLTPHIRKITRKVFDAVYVRILDLPGALAARTYECDDSMTFAVVDQMGFAEGTVLVEVTDGSAKVTRVGGPADVTLDVRHLSGLYLGRGGAGGLHAAGHLDCSAADARRIDRLFRTTQAPWCPEMF